MIKGGGEGGLNVVGRGEEGEEGEEEFPGLVLKMMKMDFCFFA